MSIFTKNIVNSGDRFFGLDLSDLSIKMLQVERKGRMDKIRSYISADIPAGHIEDGKILEKAKVAEIIRIAVKKSGPRKINTRKVVCSLPESKAFLRIINIPKVSEEEAGEAIKWELEASMPLTSDQVYYDWQFLEEAAGKQRVLTVAISREVVDDTLEVLEMAGLEVYGLEVESIASSRSLIFSQAPKQEVSIIVDIGGKKTSFIICEGSVPYFTSSIPFSSEAISETIIGKLKMNKKEAEQVKMEQGIEHSFENSSVFNVMQPLLENLSSEIEKTLDFYQSISKESASIEKIILCGGGSNLRGIIPYLTTRLSREVRIGDPWVNLNFGSHLPIIDKENAARFATAIGLALKKIEFV